MGAAHSDDTENRALNDDLKKLGYRLRPRVVEPQQPGRIAFDERGNAVYEWNDDRFSADGEAGERARRKALDHPGLSFVEEEQPTNTPIQNNARGTRIGYNPYESGLLKRKAAAPKRDLRELSKWIEMKKRVGEKNRGE
ncbi:hypothetical protein [Steroidobacter cummioxidans]|uniref:hypothetical protein n=1 Tax=Steroidobacter cummioxidans TaxID=1803913 RepID=UPI000E31DBEC|nr:hypothetical protein [Steroidobacter cummioxidans]